MHFAPQSQTISCYLFIGMSLQPEMEMVARGLEKHLKVDQREFLMNSLLHVCGDETKRSVAEALGLVCLVYYSPSLSSRSRICCSMLLCFYLSDISTWKWRLLSISPVLVLCERILPSAV